MVSQVLLPIVSLDDDCVDEMLLLVQVALVAKLVAVVLVVVVVVVVLSCGAGDSNPNFFAFSTLILYSLTRCSTIWLLLLVLRFPLPLSLSLTLFLCGSLLGLPVGSVLLEAAAPRNWSFCTRSGGSSNGGCSDSSLLCFGSI